MRRVERREEGDIEREREKGEVYKEGESGDGEVKEST